MKSISIISTSFQLINTVEYIKKNHIRYNALFIDASTKERKRKILKLINSDAFNNIFCKVYFIPNFAIRIPYLNAVLKKILFFVLFLFKRYDYVIIGNYTSVIHKYFLLKASSKNNQIKRIIVDDGTLSYSYYSVRYNEISLRKSYINNVSKFLYLLFYDDYSQLIDHSYTFFSIYAIPVISIDFLENNSMEHLRNNYHKIKDFKGHETIKNIDNIILGQPYIDIKLMSQEKYNSIIEFIVKRVEKNKTVYLCHPAEINQPTVNVDKINLDLPFECILFLLKNKCVIYGMTTSALINTKRIRPCLKIYSVNILPLININSTDYRTYLDIYESFKKSEIEILNL